MLKEVISAVQLLFLRELFHSGKKNTKSCKIQNKMKTQVTVETGKRDDKSKSNEKEYLFVIHVLKS